MEICPRVTRMPVLVDAIRCPYCGKWRNAKHVYSADGHPWRCFGCLRVFAQRVIDLRNDSSNKEIRMITSKTEHDEKVAAARDKGFADCLERNAYEPSLLECRCMKCRLAYLEGQDKAFQKKVNNK